MAETINRNKQALRDACYAGDLASAKGLWGHAKPGVEDVVSWALWMWQGVSPAPPTMGATDVEKHCTVIRWLVGQLAAHSPKTLLIGALSSADQREEWARLVLAWSSGELEKGLAAGFARAVQANASPSTLKQLCAELDPTPESLWQHATKLWRPSGTLEAPEKRTLDWLLDRVAEKGPGLLCQMQSNPKYSQLIAAWARDEFCEIDARFDRACAAGDVKRADTLYRENFAALGLEALERNLQVGVSDFAPTHPPRISAMNHWILERIAASSPKKLVLLLTLQPSLNQLIKSWACQ